MKSLLFITSQLPYPPVKGGVIVSWNLIKNLTHHFEVSLINVLKEDDPQHEAEFLSKIDLEEHYSLELNIGRTPGTLMKSYLQGVPINFIRNYSHYLVCRYGRRQGCKTPPRQQRPLPNQQASGTPPLIAAKLSSQFYLQCPRRYRRQEQ